MELIREIKDGTQIKSPQDTYNYLSEFKKEDREFFIVLGLDSNNKVMYRDVVAIGTLNSCLVHPREVFKTAVLRSVNSIITAHNHPSGNKEPSDEDLQILKQLEKAGEILGIKLLDFLIITDKEINSAK